MAAEGAATSPVVSTPPPLTRRPSAMSSNENPLQDTGPTEDGPAKKYAFRREVITGYQNASDEQFQSILACIQAKGCVCNWTMVLSERSNSFSWHILLFFLIIIIILGRTLNASMDSKRKGKNSCLLAINCCRSWTQRLRKRRSLLLWTS